VAARLAGVLVGGQGRPGPSSGSDLEFAEVIEPRPFERLAPPRDTWAVDGGQALVADARCLLVAVTRASRVRFRGGSCVLEEEGALRCHLLGGAEDRAALESLGLDLRPDTAVDLNLLRDRWEWDAVARCVAQADADAVVLADGDLCADWRLPSGYLSGLVADAAARQVTVVGVTKHTSLSRDGSPLLVALEMQAAAALGPRSRWWAPVARSRPPGGEVGDSPVARQVVAAKLDPAAPFAFRLDLPEGVAAEEVLGRIAAVSDDAAFPGYPYPLTVADRLAACPPWLREEMRLLLDEHLAAAGVDPEVRERAFADRHRLMERA
jgi:hypothetical protein